nr:Cro/CI family transcriptional regulator [Cronobacter muytjensii]
MNVLTEEAIKFFGNKTKLAIAAGVTQSAVSRWVNAGFIPKGSAAVLSNATQGKLMFDTEFYKQLKSERNQKRINKRNKTE